MSKKSRVMLTVKLGTPLPPGWTQPQLLAAIKECLKREGAPLHSFELTASVAERKVTYL